VAERRAGLERYLNRLAAHKDVARSEVGGRGRGQGWEEGCGLMGLKVSREGRGGKMLAGFCAWIYLGLVKCCFMEKKCNICCAGC
jgi:hypothetical protein